MRKGNLSTVLVFLLVTASAAMAEDYTINLVMTPPAGEVINENLSITAQAYDKTFSCYTSTTVSLPGGSDASNEYMLQLSGCNGPLILAYYTSSSAVWNSGYYSPVGTTWDWAKRGYYGQEELASVSFPLLGKKTLRGEMHLGGSPVTNWTFVNVEVKDVAGESWSHSDRIFFQPGVDVVPYEVAFPSLFENVYLRYTTQPPPRGYVGQGFYTGTETAYDAASASPIVAGGEQRGIDLTLLPSFYVAGDIQLPEGTVNEEGVDLELQTYSIMYDSTSTSVLWYDLTTVSIDPFQSAAQFSLEKPGGSTEVFLSYKTLNTQNYVRTGHFNSAGSVGKLTNAEAITGSSDFDVTGFNVMAGNEISGNVFLPPGFDAWGGARVTLTAVDQPMQLYSSTRDVYDTTTLTRFDFYSSKADLYDSSVLSFFDDTNVLHGYDTSDFIFAFPYSLRLAPDVSECAIAYTVNNLDIAKQGYRAALGNRVTGSLQNAAWVDPLGETSGLNLWLEEGRSLNVFARITSTFPVTNRIPIDIQVGRDPFDAASLYWSSTVFYDGTNGVFFTTKIHYDATDLLLGFNNRNEPGLLPWGYFSRQLYSTTSGFSYLRNTTVPSLAMAIPIALQANTTNPYYFLSIGDSAPGDINFDGELGLRDAILGLKIATSTPFDEHIISFADVNEDGLISMPEVIFVMQYISAQ